jgi:DNA-binding beta-propeller fold protein YncE
VRALQAQSASAPRCPRLRIRRPVHAVLAFAACALAVVASPASAERIYQSQITGPNGSLFTSPRSASVDDDGNVWVSDVYGGRTVYKFNSSGSFLASTASPPWGGEYFESIAFLSKAQKVFVADAEGGDLWGLAADASYVGPDIRNGLGEGCCYLQVAADNSGGPTDGDLYVSRQTSVVRLDDSGAAKDFSASAPYIDKNRLTGPFSAAGPLAVGTGGELFVASGKKVLKFDSSGVFTGLEITETTPGYPFETIGGLAVDPTSGNLLVADTGHHLIDEFDSEGEFLLQIDKAAGAPLGFVEGMAVSPTGVLYAVDAGNAVVDVYSSTPILPKVVYQPSSTAEHASIELNATVDPHNGGDVGSCQFEYGLTVAYGQVAPCGSALPFSASTPVHLTLTGLIAGSEYHYRVSAQNEHGTRYGTDRTFFSGVPELPQVAGGEASGIIPQGAVLSAEINPGFGHTVFRFQYGSTSEYGSRSYPVELPAVDNEFHPVSVNLTGLTPGTTYHFRVVAVNWSGTGYGPDQTFLTPAESPVSVPASGQSSLPSAIPTPSPGAGSTPRRRCKSGFVKRHGKCRKKHSKKGHGKHRKRSGGDA